MCIACYFHDRRAPPLSLVKETLVEETLVEETQEAEMHSSLIFVIITSLAAVEVEASGLKVSLNGSQFIPFIHGNATTDDTNISLRVRTKNPFGVLIYGRGFKRELFLLDIIQGRLRYVILGWMLCVSCNQCFYVPKSSF